MSHSPPPVSLRPAAPSYLMGTPDCLMCVTAVQRTPHPAVLIWSHHGPTAALSRRSASRHLQGKRSIQVTSRLARQVTHDYLYRPKQTWLQQHSAHFPLSACFKSTPSHGAGRCRLEATRQPRQLSVEAGAEVPLNTVPLWALRSSCVAQHISV